MKKILGAIVLVGVLSIPFLAFAVVGTSGGTPSSPECAAGKVCNPIKYDTFSDFVAAVTKTAVEILIPFVVLAFIYSGFLFIRAQGNPEGLEEAKKAIWWSMVGAFILLGAWGFAQVISTTISTITN
ncbi:MAG: hypothetical protein HZB10_01850 [Candidatus Yonathbacteria bacterium]|nr:hypothetical protein [Candidatus Yonathbacteria bacterium]